MKKNKENVYHEKEQCENDNVKELILCLHIKKSVFL